MAETEPTRERLLKLRKDLSEQADDPSILEYDLDDPSVILRLIMHTVILRGETIKITANTEGSRTETLSIRSVGANTDDQPFFEAIISSSDGTFSPEAADMVAKFMHPSFGSEVNNINGDSLP